jgi:hypothetical protein
VPNEAARLRIVKGIPAAPLEDHFFATPKVEHDSFMFSAGPSAHHLEFGSARQSF